MDRGGRTVKPLKIYSASVGISGVEEVESFRIIDSGCDKFTLYGSTTNGLFAVWVTVMSLTVFTRSRVRVAHVALWLNWYECSNTRAGGVGAAQVLAGCYHYIIIMLAKCNKL